MLGAKHMEEASGARSLDATRVPLKARRVGAQHMGGASGARSLDVTKVPLTVQQVGAHDMGGKSTLKSLWAINSALARWVIKDWLGEFRSH